MLGSNNYLGPDRDERVKQGARDALERYGTALTGSRFLNGTIDLHLELEAELAEWMGTEAAIVFTTGHQANLGAIASLLEPADTVVVDSGDHASILDGAILSRAKLRAFRHNRLDRLEHTLKRAAGDGGGVLTVVDGVFSMEGDVAPAGGDRRAVRPPRLAADGGRGPRGRRAGCARRRRQRAAGRRGPRRPAHGHVLQVAGLLRRVHRRRRPRWSTTCASPRGRSCSPPPAVPAAVGAALAAVRICRSDEGPSLFSAVLDNARYLHSGLRELGLAVAEPMRLPDGRELVTPIVPVLIGDDWKAALLWRALYDAGVYVNVALHPAVPPARRAAAHERDGHPRARRAGPRAGGVRRGQALVRGRARSAADRHLTVPPDR